FDSFNAIIEERIQTGKLSKMTFKVVLADEAGIVVRFENEMIRKAEQEYRTGKGKEWTQLAEMYVIQKRRLETDPYPEDFNNKSSDDESPPVVKLVSRQTKLKELFRWGIKIGAIGNHRILYIVHHYYKVVLLYYFNKQYNGDIKLAEEQYFKLLEHDSSYYTIRKG